MKALRQLGLLIVAVILFPTAVLAQTITVYSSGKIAVGQTRQLTAYVPLSPNTVTWTVNDIPGGDETVGTISPGGLYRAPANVPPVPSVVRATSTAYPAKSGAVTMTVTQVPVQLWSISPTSTTAGPYSIRINGANLTPATVVYAGDTALATTYKSSTSLTATGNANGVPLGTKLSIRVKNPGLGGTTSDAVTLEVKAGEPTTPTPTSITVSLNPGSASLGLGATQQFTATVRNATDTSVIYTVNGVSGGNPTVGTITPEGLYTAPAGVPSGAISIRATATASATSTATAAITLIAPPNPGTGQGTGNLAAARFLEQAAFGPSPTDLTRVQQIGIDAWLDEQFAAPETVIGEASNSSVLQQQYLSRLSTAPDQLRQRVANALGQIIVISMNKNIYPNEMIPYLQILSRNAFGNYRTLLGEITVSSPMGKYLDMANSNKPSNGSGANENYPRELLQLFSIGLYQLNPDGTQKLDADGKPIPTYDQAAVQQIALAFTGWTYPGPQNNNWENFSGPMQPKDVNHDMRAKSFLGCTLAANQTAVQDKDATLDCIFKHPNVGPFIASRLIRSLVTSNPSPAYIQRVAAAFDDNGAGVRGDLKATVRAILRDTEARTDTATPNAGRLKDPIYHLVSFVRAMDGSINMSNGLPWMLSQMAQTPLTPPSVFSYYSPSYRVPKSPLTGPEFQIYTPTESVLRGNLFWQFISNPSQDATINLAPFTAVAGDPARLIDAVDQALLYGRMPQSMRQTLANIIVAQNDNASKVQIALYLTALSGFSAVQH